MDNIQKKIFGQYKNFKISLSERVKEFRKQKGITGGPNKDGIADTITCMDFYYQKEHSENELKKIITDGDKDLCFVDTIVVRGDEVDIFDIKTNGEHSNLDAIKLGIDGYFENSPKDYESVNTILASALKKIHEKRYKKINLIFIREFNDQQAEDKFIKKYEHLSQKRSLELKVFTRAKLIQRRQGSFDVDSLTLKETQLYDGKIKNMNWAITVTSLADILKQYEKIPDRDLLFSKNIREPLEEKKQKDILTRSLQSDAKTFHYRHNGIVMTGTLIEKEGNGLKVYSPQVLNGAQTLGALFAIYKENKSLFKNARIVIKVLSVDNQQIIDDICEAANTQRPVTTADIRTNDSLQKNLELYIGSIANGEYRYIRGKVSSQKKKQYKKLYRLIEKEAFIQWANSAFLRKPYESKTQKTKLFAKVFSERSKEPYKEIEKSIIDNWDNIESLCKIAICVNNKIKELPKDNSNNAKIMDQHIIATMYSSYLIEKTLDDTFLNKAFNKALAKHTLAFKNAAKGRDLKMRNYFINNESF